MKCVREFLKEINFIQTWEEMAPVEKNFLSDMEKGLKGEKSSLPMIPAYLTVDALPEESRDVIVMDAGGTNLRVSLLRITPGQKPEILEHYKQPVPGKPGPISPDQFFEELAKAVQAEVERQLALLPREPVARKSIENNSKILLCKTLDEAVSAANTIAPEHLEICTDDPFAILSKIKNAGSIFLGKNAPEALGDYFAGPNHTLPTSGTARFSSPLGVDDFIKKSQFIYYTRDALEQVAQPVAAFAREEGLEGHARSVTVRFEKGENS